MAFNEHVIETKADPDDHSIEFVVEHSAALEVKVKANSFKHLGRTFTIPLDETFTCTDRSDDTQLMCYLVRDLATDQEDIFWDEVILDGVDAPFDFPDPDYECLMQLFSLLIPANTSDLDGLTLVLWKITDINA